MRHEFSISYDATGLSEISIKVPKGYRGAGLAVLDAALPALRDLTRRLQHPVEDAVPDEGDDVELRAGG
jgi:hypothetical protein